MALPPFASRRRAHRPRPRRRAHHDAHAPQSSQTHALRPRPRQTHHLSRHARHPRPRRKKNRPRRRVAQSFAPLAKFCGFCFSFCLCGCPILGCLCEGWGFCLSGARPEPRKRPYLPQSVIPRSHATRDLLLCFSLCRVPHPELSLRRVGFLFLSRVLLFSEKCSTRFYLSLPVIHRICFWRPLRSSATFLSHQHASRCIKKKNAPNLGAFSCGVQIASENTSRPGTAQLPRQTRTPISWIERDRRCAAEPLCPDPTARNRAEEETSAQVSDSWEESRKCHSCPAGKRMRARDRTWSEIPS